MKSVSARLACGRPGDVTLGDCTRELVGVHCVCGEVVRGDVGLRRAVLAASELVRGDNPLTASDDEEPTASVPGFGLLDELGTGRGCATA